MNFPLRYSIHGPELDGSWNLTVYRFKWELCPKEGSYVNYLGPFILTNLTDVVTKVSAITSTEDKE